MTDQKLFPLSAKAQEWLRLSPELTSRFSEVVQVNHEPPKTFDGFTWFVVLTNPKCEMRAQLGLRRKGYQTYLPVMKRWRTISRKREAVENALLPRYMFVGLRGYGTDQGQDFFRMQGVDGVEAILRNNTRPVRVGSKALEALRQREAAGDFDCEVQETLEAERLAEEERLKAERQEALRLKVKPGDQVTIKKDGPMAGMMAVVSEVQSSGRIEVLLEFLGGLTPAKLAANEVEILEAAE